MRATARRARRPPPPPGLADLDAERELVGDLIASAEARAATRDIDPRDLAEPTYRALLGAIRRLETEGTPIGPSVVAGEAEVSAAVVEACVIASMTPATASWRARRIRTLATRRRLTVEFERLARAATSDADAEELLERAQRVIDDERRRSPQAAASAATCCAQKIEMLPVEWLWRHRIPSGMLSMFDGDPGLCKSTVIADLAARLSRAEPLPGDEGREPTTSILISYEDSASHVVVPRLVAAGADLSRVHVWDLDARPFALDDEGLVALEAEITRTRAGWVSIDPLMAALPADLNAHRDQDVRRALAKLAKLAERTDCAITFVRHLNKSGGGNALYRGGGSIGIIGAARAGMILGLDPEDADAKQSGARVLAMTKCNVGRPAPAMRLRVVSAPAPAPGIEVARIEWEGESQHTADDLVAERAEREESSDAETWLRSLLEGGPQASEEIKRQARSAGISWRTVERAKQAIGARARRRGFGAAGEWQWFVPGNEREADNA